MQSEPSNIDAFSSEQEPETHESPTTGRPWRFWSTIWLSLAAGVVTIVGQIIFSIGWVVIEYVRHGKLNSDTLIENGNFMLGCTLFSYPFALCLILLIIKLRKPNTLSNYLALKKPGWKSMAIWVGWFCGLMVLTEIASSLHNQPPSEFMLQLISTANIGLVFLVLVVCGPVAEELFFRGFMFRGIAASKAGTSGAVVLTSLFWAAIHGIQYDWFELLVIIVFGVFLALARLKTGSIVVPLVLHIVNNAIAVVTFLALP